jgi:hypothetical protein
MVVVAHGKALAATAGRGEQREQPWVDRRAWPGQRHGRLLQGGRALPEPGRQHLVQFGQGADRCLRQAGDRIARGPAQPDHDRDRLVIVKLQRRQGRP